MRKLLLIAVSSLALSSCTDDRSKAASEFCSCFSSKAKEFSSDFKKVMGKVADSDDPKKTLEKEVAKLDDETKLSVAQEMQSLGGIENDPIMKKCEKRIAEYKVRGKDEMARMKVVLEEMRGESNCQILTALVAIGLQDQAGGGKVSNDETSSDDESVETKKKKKTTEDE